MNSNDTLINLNKSRLIEAGTPEIQSSEKLRISTGENAGDICNTHGKRHSLQITVTVGFKTAQHVLG